MNYLYLSLNLFAISYPLAQSFEWRLQYARKWKALFPAIGITGFFFIVWDIWFTKIGVWGFNPDYLTGLYLANLPVEEWLFFLAVPFASVFIYECVWYFLPGINNQSWIKIFSLALAIVLLTLAVLNNAKSYTFFNFFFGGVFLGFITYRSPEWLAKFWAAYILHLFPFLAVNGVLTGSWIQEQVVWYNNAENLNIRIATIPIEDSIYALLLLLMNVFFYEVFMKKMNLKRTTSTKPS